MRIAVTFRLLSPLLLVLASTAWAEPTVSLELVTEGGFPLGGEQRALEALKGFGFSGIRIRGARAGDHTDIKQTGTGNTARYHVIGILTERNKLSLTGATFSLNDQRGIRNWLENLKDGGAEGITSPRGAFGLTGKQLLAVNDALSTKVNFSTKGKPTGDVVRDLLRLLSIKATIDPTARRTLGGGETVNEELQGLTAGTVLAATLRPLGLVVAPHKPRGAEPSLLITDVRSVETSWPVGWPSKKSAKNTLPKMFEFLKVEIADFQLNEALDAIQKRLEVPFLFDHNALARHEIDVTKVKVSLPNRRTYYKSIVSKLLRQGMLKAEVRVDEAGQAFLWITTIKR